MKTGEYITVKGFDGIDHSGFKANKRNELPKNNVFNTDAFYDENMDMWVVWSHHGKQTKHYLIKDKRLF
jgi:hypothetical protein